MKIFINLSQIFILAHFWGTPKKRNSANEIQNIWVVFFQFLSGMFLY